MQTTFEKVHQGHILGTLTTVDRLIIRGHLMAFWYDRAFRNFLHVGAHRKLRFFGWRGRDSSSSAPEARLV